MPLSKLFSRKISKDKQSHSANNSPNVVKSEQDVPLQNNESSVEITAAGVDLGKDNFEKQQIFEEKCIGNKDLKTVEVAESTVDTSTKPLIENNGQNGRELIKISPSSLQEKIFPNTPGVFSENKEQKRMSSRNSSEKNLMLFSEDELSDTLTASDDATNENFNNHKTYARSISENDVNKDLKKGKRTKCYSESGLPEDDIQQRTAIFEEVIRGRGKSLEDAISKCIDKMIRDSIVSAIKSVNVESLYEELVKDMCDYKPSSSSDEVHVNSNDPRMENLNVVSDETMNNNDVCIENVSTVSEETNVNKNNECIENINVVSNKTNVMRNDVCIEKMSVMSEIKTAKDEILSFCEEINSADCVENKSCERKADDLFEEKHIVLEKCEVHDEEESGHATRESCEKSITEENQDTVFDVYHVEYEELASTALDGYHADCEESASIYSNVSSEGNLDEQSCQNEACSENFVPEQKMDRKLITREVIAITGVLSGTSHRESESGNMITDSQGSIMSLPEQTNSSPSIDSTGAGLSSQEASLDDIPQKQYVQQEEEKKINWKVGYLQVKLPHKGRGKAHLKVWKKRWVLIQPDEFVNDPKNPCLMISVYNAESGTSRKHSAIFWKAVSCQKAVVYRSSSRSHRYAFTISDDDKAVIHLAADTETLTQEWMAAVRAILWPPSPVVQLEKMLSGNEFDISLIDNAFSYHAGLLGMYGYLSITPKKLILLHPQQGYVIQEWYLNTVDKFQLTPQSKVDDVNKVLSMTTCSDSSTGKGEILLFCNDAVSLLQTLAQTIHEVLTHHSKKDGGKYQKELQDIADWLIGPTSSSIEKRSEDYYQVPPRQVKSLLDIPNFIFEKSLSPVSSMADTTSAVTKTTKELKTNPTRSSQDSGISTENPMDDLLNCSVASFTVGGGALTGKSSDSELSDAYSPPASPILLKKHSGTLTAEDFTESPST